MASLVQQPSEPVATQVYNARYIYYSRYPIAPARHSSFSWHKALRAAWTYVRLVIITVLVSGLGSALPMLIANEFFFKPLLANDCDKCLITGARPYFEVDLMSASFMVVMGFVLPILSVMLLLKVIRSPGLRRELFN